MPTRNLHGTAVVLADHGVLITGRSGAGKSALALSLIEALSAHGRFARLVADDQVLLHAAGGRLIVSTPPALEGLLEARGLGPIPVRWEGRAVIDLVVRLVDVSAAPRYQEQAVETIAGVHLPSISLAERSARGAVFALLGRLGL